ncbi:MAG: hypothetical protein WC738_03740 [Candidatus Omnitrophota bacterium]|jgi:hypothetical protein
MSYFQILDRPAGTLGYQQGAGEQLAGMSSELASGVKDAIFRKALQNSQLEPEFEVGEDGKMKIKYKTKKAPTATEMKNRLELYANGFTPASSVSPALDTEIKKNAPFTMPFSDGGKVGTSPGTIAKDGYYYNKNDTKFENPIGEYDEAAGPGTKDTATYDSVAREALKRQLTGMKKPEKTIEQKAQESVDLDKAKEKIRGPGYITDKAQSAAELAAAKDKAKMALIDKELGVISGNEGGTASMSKDGYTIGQIVEKGGKRYKVVGFNPQGKAIVDENPVQ